MDPSSVHSVPNSPQNSAGLNILQSKPPLSDQAPSSALSPVKQPPLIDSLSSSITHMSTGVQASVPSSAYDLLDSGAAVQASQSSSAFNMLGSGSAIQAQHPVAPSFVASSQVEIKGKVSSCDGVHPVQLRAREMGRLFVNELRPELVKESFVLSTLLFSKGPLSDVTFDEELLKKMRKTWSVTRCQWRKSINLSSEKDMAKWLNDIGTEFCKVQGLTLLRCWSAESCIAPLQGASSNVLFKVKPDLILKSKDLPRPGASSWGNIDAFGEVTSQATYHAELQQTVYTKSHVLFATQESRRFVASIAFYGKNDSMYLRLTVIDREGLVFQLIPLKTATGGYNALRVIAGFMCGEAASLGFDPTVTLDSAGQVDTITVEGSKSKATYKVKKKLHVATGLTGRCTRVWQAHDVSNPTKHVIIKDAWPYASKASAESSILKRLQGIPGIPKMLTAVTVKLQGDEGCAPYCDTTDGIRRELAPADSRTRKHRRLVMESLGVKIHHFSQLSELIGAFRDVIAAHRDACARGVLHRDISLNNVMLECSGAKRRGLLIDFDHALYQMADDTELAAYKPDDYDNDDNDGSSDLPSLKLPMVAVAVPEMLMGVQPTKANSGTVLEDVQLAMGTPPFIATAILMGTEKHEGRHDLESVFYALLYALTVFKGPNSLRKDKDYAALSSFPPILEWFDLKTIQSSFHKMGRTKMGHLIDFERAILNKMDPYFEELRPFVQLLFNATFHNDNYRRSHLTHDLMIGLFNAEYERLLALEEKEKMNREQEDEINRPRKRARSEYQRK